MQEILREYGRAVIAMFAVTAIVALLLNPNLLKNAELTMDTSDPQTAAQQVASTQAGNTLIDQRLKEYAKKQSEQTVVVATKLSANAKYSVYSLIEIDGVIGETDASGNKRIINITAVENETGTNVVDSVYYENENELLFTTPGLYRMRLNITGANGAKTSGWYAVGVVGSKGACGDAADGIHIYKDKIVTGTCVTNGYTMHTCIFCGDTYRDSVTVSNGHDFSGKGTIIQKANCTQDGFEKHVCNLCGFTETLNYVNASGHDEISESKQKTYCDEEAYSRYTCKTCGNVREGTKVPATKHSLSGYITDFHTNLPDVSTLNASGNAGTISNTYTISSTGNPKASANTSSCYLVFTFGGAGWYLCLNGCYYYVGSNEIKAIAADATNKGYVSNAPSGTCLGKIAAWNVPNTDVFGAFWQECTQCPYNLYTFTDTWYNNYSTSGAGTSPGTAYGPMSGYCYGYWGSNEYGIKSGTATLMAPNGWNGYVDPGKP